MLFFLASSRHTTNRVCFSSHIVIITPELHRGRFRGQSLSAGSFETLATANLGQAAAPTYDDAAQDYWITGRPSSFIVIMYGGEGCLSPLRGDIILN